MFILVEVDAIVTLVVLNTELQLHKKYYSEDGTG